VLHIPGLGFDGLIGYSPIAMAKNAVSMSIATEEYGANPGGVLEHPGTIKDAQRLKDNWNTQYQGGANAHKVAILEEGMKFQAVGIPPEQAQFLETHKFRINEIARLSTARASSLPTWARRTNQKKRRTQREKQTILELGEGRNHRRAHPLSRRHNR
jgi:hypothetical protein